MQKIIYFLFLIILISCGRLEKPNYPILEEQKLINLLVDYHIAKGMMSADGLKKYKWDKQQINAADSVLKEYGVSKVVFDSTINYYAGYPAVFDGIYEKVITELSRRQAKIQQHSKDELNKVKKK